MIVPDMYSTVAEHSQEPLFVGAGISPYDYDLEHCFDKSRLPLPPQRTGTLVMEWHAPTVRSLGMETSRMSAFVLANQWRRRLIGRAPISLFRIISTGDTGKDDSVSVLMMVASSLVLLTRAGSFFRSQMQFQCLFVPGWPKLT